MYDRSITPNGGGTEQRPIFVTASTIFWKLSKILDCLYTSFCCCDLTSAATWAKAPGLYMKASKILLTNSGEYTTLCTVRKNNVSKAFDRRLSTLILFLTRVSNANHFAAFSTCTGIPATMMRLKIFSLIKGATKAFLMFVVCSFDATRRTNMINNAAGYGSSPVGKGNSA